LYACANLELDLWELGDDPVVLAKEEVVDYRHSCLQVHPTQKYVHKKEDSGKFNFCFKNALSPFALVPV